MAIAKSVCHGEMFTDTVALFLKSVPPLEKGAAQRAGDGSASERRSLRSRMWGADFSDNQLFTVTTIHPAALPRPFSKGLHADGRTDMERIKSTVTLFVKSVPP